MPARHRRGAGPSVAVIVPVLHEPDLPARLDLSLARHALDELIVVHAGDADTAAALRAWSAARAVPGARVLRAPRGRARQMNRGAARARSDVLLFLHADTALPAGGVEAVRAAILAGACWGRFDVRLSGRHPWFRLIERMMTWRSALSGIATGDQAMFVRRDVFAVLGGFAPIELMEDIEMSARLKIYGPPARIRAPVVTSSRRWEQRGIVRTVMRMWLLRLLYAAGVSPRRLARWYR